MLIAHSEDETLLITFASSSQSLLLQNWLCSVKVCALRACRIGRFLLRAWECWGTYVYDLVPVRQAEYAPKTGRLTRYRAASCGTLFLKKEIMRVS